MRKGRATQKRRKYTRPSSMRKQVRFNTPAQPQPRAQRTPQQLSSANQLKRSRWRSGQPRKFHPTTQDQRQKHIE